MLLLILGLLFAPRVTVANSCEDSLLEAQSLWIVPKHSEKLLIGLMVETDSGLYLLGVGNYFLGDHSLIFERINRQFPVKRIVWGGELLLRNDSGFRAPGRIAMTLDTSGFVWQRLKSHPNPNSRVELEHVLALYRPGLLSEAAQHYSFGEKYSHLDAYLRGLDVRISGAAGGARHALRNLLSVMFLYFNPKALSPKYTWDQELQTLRTEVSARTVEEFISFCEDLMEFAPGSVSNHVSRQLIKELRLYLADGIRTEDSFRSLLRRVVTVESGLYNARTRYEVIPLNLQPASQSSSTETIRRLVR